MVTFGRRTPVPERVALIKRWSRWFCERTESWHGRIGTELAYLFQAMANDIFFWVDRDSMVLELLRREGIRRDDPVWRYIRLRWEHDN